MWQLPEGEKFKLLIVYPITRHAGYRQGRCAPGLRKPLKKNKLSLKSLPRKESHSINHATRSFTYGILFTQLYIIQKNFRSDIWPDFLHF